MMNGVNGVSAVPVIKLQGNEQCTCPVETDCKCEKSEDEKVDPSLYGKIMQNLALATMMMNNRRSSLTQRNIEQMNLQMQQQNDLMNNLLMQQQAMQAHQQAMQNNMTAVQMSTPGMGII